MLVFFLFWGLSAYCWQLLKMLAFMFKHGFDGLHTDAVQMYHQWRYTIHQKNITIAVAYQDEGQPKPPSAEAAWWAQCAAPTWPV